MMTETLQYAPLLNLLPLGLVLLMAKEYRMIKDDITKRATKLYSDDTFQRKDIADERQEVTNVILNEIKSDIKTLLQQNGK